MKERDATGQHESQVGPSLDLYDDRYMHATNLQKADGNFREVKVVVSRVTKESVTAKGGKKTLTNVAYFEGKRRGLPLTRPNAREGTLQLGPNWIGKELTLHAVSGTFWGKYQTIVRIKQRRD